MCASPSPRPNPGLVSTSLPPGELVEVNRNKQKFGIWLKSGALWEDLGSLSHLPFFGDLTSVPVCVSSECYVGSPGLYYTPVTHRSSPYVCSAHPVGPLSYNHQTSLISLLNKHYAKCFILRSSPNLPTHSLSCILALFLFQVRDNLPKITHQD